MSVGLKIPKMPRTVFSRNSMRFVRVSAVDVILLLGAVVLLGALIHVGQEWAGTLQAKVEIDLSPWALPGYVMLSLTRGLVAYAISLTFTLIYAYWAAKHRPSGWVLLPLLDILQSIPVLGFMPGLVLGLITIFPGSNFGLELAAVLMIFTGQAWNMTFSFHRSLTSLPTDQAEAAAAFRFTWWQRLRWVELPFATTGLVWNSMMSMAGGWFFLMLSETFTLGERDFRLPGLGSYMQEALNAGHWPAMIMGILAMIMMITFLDQLLWRPLVVWAERFRVEDSAAEVAQESWFLTVLRQSPLLKAVGRRLSARKSVMPVASLPVATAGHLAHAVAAPVWGTWLAWLAFTILIGCLGWGARELFAQLIQVPLSIPLGTNTPEVAVSGAVSWVDIARGAGLTGLRVFGALALGTLWALPVGLAIGRSPVWSRRLQPVVQVAASFPAPMLFPLFLLFFNLIGLPLEIGAMILMLLGTQWYVLFNVIAGAQAVPSDLREATSAFRLSPFERFVKLEVPGIFPALVTGWVTAAGGAWNASIVAEYLTWKEKVYTVDGLGSLISFAASHANFPALAAAVTFMSVVVVAINVVCWRRLHLLAQGRFSLNK